MYALRTYCRTPDLKTQQSPVIFRYWICVKVKLVQGNYLIIASLSFSKSFVLKYFFVHSWPQRRRFQIPPVRRAFLKSSIFVTDYCGLNQRNKASCGVVWMGPKGYFWCGQKNWKYCDWEPLLTGLWMRRMNEVIYQALETVFHIFTRPQTVMPPFSLRFRNIIRHCLSQVM